MYLAAPSGFLKVGVELLKLGLQKHCVFPCRSKPIVVAPEQRERVSLHTCRHPCSLLFRQCVSAATVVVHLWCRYVPARTTSTIAATGTNPHTAKAGCSHFATRFYRHYSGQPAPLSQHYGATTTVCGRWTSRGIDVQPRTHFYRCVCSVVFDAREDRTHW